MPHTVHIASLLVHSQPSALEAVKAFALTLPHVEVHSQSPQGKLVLVCESDHEKRIADYLDALNAQPSVLSAALIYHEIAPVEETEGCTP
ncbi:periplasmic nitrate reductase chaperone NapD [Atopomonas hussainii]|uniref:Chaperone NapD n=1 Tax=Atopomonas hussainii TaxID=1429083 RepID=A0A1H7MFG2_9GAMM|nr:chaperone NapD [Atopomonas hussainii]SEL09445.1 periplasmic nitrate reductase chaperone NapD [Atopomonas hussainii]